MFAFLLIFSSAILSLTIGTFVLIIRSLLRTFAVRKHGKHILAIVTSILRSMCCLSGDTPHLFSSMPIGKTLRRGLCITLKVMQVAGIYRSIIHQVLVSMY